MLVARLGLLLGPDPQSRQGPRCWWWKDQLGSEELNEINGHIIADCSREKFSLQQIHCIDSPAVWPVIFLQSLHVALWSSRTPRSNSDHSTSCRENQKGEWSILNISNLLVVCLFLFQPVLLEQFWQGRLDLCRGVQHAYIKNPHCQWWWQVWIVQCSVQM